MALVLLASIHPASQRISGTLHFIGTVTPYHQRQALDSSTIILWCLVFVITGCHSWYNICSISNCLSCVPLSNNFWEHSINKKIVHHFCLPFKKFTVYLTSFNNKSTFTPLNKTTIYKLFYSSHLHLNLIIISMLSFLTSIFRHHFSPCSSFSQLLCHLAIHPWNKKDIWSLWTPPQHEQTIRWWWSVNINKQTSIWALKILVLWNGLLLVCFKGHVFMITTPPLTMFQSIQ